MLASGINRVDEKSLKEELGEKLLKGDANFVRNVTGFAIGGIPPIGHKTPIKTYIDEDLCQYDSLWAAAGTPHAAFNLSPAILKYLENSKILRIKK